MKLLTKVGINMMIRKISWVTLKRLMAAGSLGMGTDTMMVTGKFPTIRAPSTIRDILVRRLVRFSADVLFVFFETLANAIMITMYKTMFPIIQIPTKGAVT